MAQYHANLEIEFAGNQIGQSFSDSIKEAFNTGDTYSHEIFQTADGKYHLSYLGNGYSDGNKTKKSCVNLAKRPEIVAFSLKGDLDNEGSGGGYLDAVKAEYNNGCIKYKYWCDCYMEGWDIDRVFMKLVPAIDVIDQVDSVLHVEFTDSVADGYIIGNKAKIEEIIFTGDLSTIKTGQFEAFPNLKRISLPDTVMYFEPKAFKDCASLTEVNIPKSLESVFDNSIVNCPNLKMDFGPEVEVIKTGGCADYKEKMYETMSRFDEKVYYNALFDYILTSNDVVKAADKVAKNEGLASKNNYLWARGILVDYFSKMQDKSQVEQAVTTLFTEKAIEKMKTKFAIVMGYIMAMSTNEISNSLGIKPSAVSSVVRYGYIAPELKEWYNKTDHT